MGKDRKVHYGGRIGTEGVTTLKSKVGNLKERHPRAAEGSEPSLCRVGHRCVISARHYARAVFGISRKVKELRKEVVYRFVENYIYALYVANVYNVRKFLIQMWVY